MSNRCKEKTLKGHVCTRKPLPDQNYCWQHKPGEEETGPQAPIWEQKGYPTPSEDLSRRYKNRIRTKLKNGPPKSDKVGYIYVYQLKDDETGEYYKIGRTIQSVKKRLRQWSKNTVLVESFRVKCNVFCETLIHAYLDECRVYRYKLDDKDDDDNNIEEEFCTVWKSDGMPVTKKDQCRMDKYRLQGKKKQVEWFYAKEKKDLLDIVEKVCELNK